MAGKLVNLPDIEKKIAYLPTLELGHYDLFSEIYDNLVETQKPMTSDTYLSFTNLVVLSKRIQFILCAKMPNELGLYFEIH